MRKLDKNQKRKQFRIWLSPEEKALAKAKAEQYGYKTLSNYMRDATIYESLLEINVQGLDNMAQEFNEYVKEVKGYTKELRRILKYNTGLSSEEKNELQKGLYQIYQQLKVLQKEVDKKIDYEVIEKIGKEKMEVMNNAIYEKNSSL